MIDLSIISRKSLRKKGQGKMPRITPKGLAKSQTSTKRYTSELDTKACTQDLLKEDTLKKKD